MRTLRFGVLTVVTALTIGVPLATAGGTASSGGTLAAEKTAIQRRIDTEYRDALASDRPAKSRAATPQSSGTEPGWRSGIIESGQAPLPAAGFVIENQWHDVIGGEHVNVYAGVERADPSRGLVVVDTTPLDLNGDGTPGGVYYSPAATGSLRIVQAAGSTLVLVSARGSRFVFDAAARRFSER
jgi:hypothetical protein